MYTRNVNIHKFVMNTVYMKAYKCFVETIHNHTRLTGLGS